MQSHAFENQLKKIVGRSFPRGIGRILVESGFDCTLAIALVNQSSIKVIEEYVNEHKNILNGTAYENSPNFKLKPGHKAIILGLPQALIDYEQKKQKIRVCPFDEEKLKQKLVEKITKFAQKFSYDLIFGVELISEFFENKCRFECPVCFTTIKCEYIRYWLISNLEKHIKNIVVQTIEIEPENRVESIEQVPHLNSVPQVISYIGNPEQMISLDDILNE